MFDFGSANDALIHRNTLISLPFLLHIGFTLVLAWSFWLVPVTMAVHSAVNLILVRTFKRAPLLSELALLVVGAATLLTGLALIDRL